MFSLKTVCFVTGASRGLGESIAVNLACKFPAGSMIVLLARNESALEIVKKGLLEKAPHVTAVTRRFDQSSQDQSQYNTLFSQTLESVDARAADFQQAIIIHNAGSIEPVKYIRNLPGVQELRHYFDINLSGVIALTTEFLKFFPGSSAAGRVVINISSLAAIQPFKSWAPYSTGKAARDMFFKVLAAEEEGIRVLNYAPGPLETDMSDLLMRDSEDESVRNWAVKTKAEKQLLNCDTSVAKLIQCLEKNTFENGAHIDYYDEL